MKTKKLELKKSAPVAVVGFAGGGGVECGLLAAGIRPALSIEFDPSNPELSDAIADVHDRNFGEYGKLLRMTVQDWADKGFPDCPEKVDYAHFSPVCSNFSSETNRGDQPSDRTAADAIAHFIDAFHPKAITIENVPEYQNSDSWEIIERALTSNDYYPKLQVLDFSEHGVPQTRKRFICIAVKDYIVPDLCTQPRISWLEAIGDYRHLPEAQLVDNQIEALKEAEKAEVYLLPRIGYRDLPRLTPSYSPAPTIKRSIFHDQNNNGRNLFWNIWDGEKAYQVDFDCIRKLGTFPDWYQFPGDIAISGAIVGYSVPPTIIEQIYSLLERLMWSQYEFHPLANLFPLLQDNDASAFQSLVQSIRTNGLITPIVLYEGKILDGRNRYLACLSTGVKTRFVDWQATEACPDVLLYVLALNLERRHLNQSQRAAIYLEANAIAVEEELRRAKERQKEAGAKNIESYNKSLVQAPVPELEKPSQEKKPAPQSRDRIAQQIGVGSRTVQDVQLVKDKDPVLFEQVKAGKISGKSAATQIRKEEERTAPQQTTLLVEQEEETTKEDDLFDEEFNDEELEEEIGEEAQPDDKSLGKKSDEPLDKPQKDGSSNEWYTPADLIFLVKQVLGEIDLDPASCEFANRGVKAKNFYSKEQDGLSLPWHGSIFCNPPYSKPAPWCDRIVSSYLSGEIEQAILLINSGTETIYFQSCLQNAALTCIKKGRINFVRQKKEDEEEKSESNRYSQVFFYFGKKPDLFASVFSQLGTIVVPYDFDRSKNH